MTEKRLYGTPGAEDLHFDLASAYESHIDPWVDTDQGADGDRTWEIEEWSVAPPVSHLPEASRLLEWIGEWSAESGMVTEDWFEDYQGIEGNETVLEAAETLLCRIGDAITYRMAQQRLRTFTVTWGDQGEPLADGEPIYQQAMEESAGQVES